MLRLGLRLGSVSLSLPGVPVYTGDSAFTVVEGEPYILTTLDFDVTDSDTADENITLTFSAPTNGVIEVDGVEASEATHAQFVAGLVEYVHDGSDTLSDSFTITASDGTTTLSARTITITVDPVYTALTWNPDDKGNDITLSANNFTALNANNSTDAVRLEAFKSNGKYYCEIDLSPNNPSVAAFVGFSNPNCIISRSAGGKQPNALFLRANGTVSDINGSVTDAWSGWTSSDTTIGLAFDLALRKCWVTKDGTFTGANFETGEGGFDLPDGDLSLHCNPRSSDSSLSMTVTTTKHDFTYSIPSGFSAYASGEIPTISGDFAFSVDENGTYVFTTSDFTATDDDTANLIYKVVILPGDGEVYVDGADFEPGETITVSHADLVAGNLKYTNYSEGAATDTIGIAASDGTNVTRYETVTVTVTLTDNAPVLSGTFAATCEQGLSVPITTTVLTAADSDTADGSLTYTVTSPTNGVVQVSGSTETSFTAADVKAGNVTYLNDGASAADGSFTVALSDGTTTLDTQVISITVNAAPDQVTWDSGNAHADIDLTNSDLTANNPENSLGAVMGDASKSTGKWLFAVDIDTGSTLVTTTNVGVSTSSGALDAGAGGTQSDMTIARQNGAIVSPDGTATSAWDGFSSSGGDRVYVIVDFDAGECWFGNDTDGITGDPVAGTGGSTIPAGALFPRVLPRTTGGTAGFTLVSRRMDLTDSILDDLYADGWNAWAEGDAAPLPAMTPMQSDHIVEKLAAVANFNFNTSLYATDDWLDYYAALGFRYIRGGIKESSDGLARMNYLYNTHGIKLITPPASKTNQGNLIPVLDHDQITDALEFLDTGLAAGALAAVESINEPNKSNSDDQWDERVAAAQHHIFDETRRLFGSGVTVMSPSIYRRDATATADFVASAGTDHCDMANVHTYTGGRMPHEMAQGYPPRTPATPEQVINTALTMTTTGEWAITEWGHEFREDPDDRDQFLMSPDAAAIYYLRGVLTFAKLGAKWITWYATLDNILNGSLVNMYGLMVPNGDGTYTNRAPGAAIKNFIDIYEDAGADFSVTDLNVQLSGDLTNVNTALTEKRDGTYLLAIWLDERVWDRQAQTETTPAARTVTVSLDDAFDVTQHKPTFTTSTTSLGTGVTSFDVDALGEVVILELTPSA